MTVEIHEERIVEEPIPFTNGAVGSNERHEEVYVVHDNDGVYRETVTENVGLERSIMLSRGMQLIWLIVGLLEALIGLRIVLKLIAANPSAPFARLVYDLSDLFLWPFFGLTVTPATEGGVVLELSSIIAMVVYAVAVWALIKIVYLFFMPATSRTVAIYDQRRL